VTCSAIGALYSQSPANLTTLHNLISVQSTYRTRSSSAVTIALSVYLPHYKLPTTLSDMHHLTNLSKAASSFRQPHPVHCPPGSPHPAHITSSQYAPFLSPSITPSVFYSGLKTHLFHKSFPPQFFWFLLDYLHPRPEPD